MRPPRALWVSFELGRPFGVPDDADFQHDVLRAALDLLVADEGPVLVDYPHDAPSAQTDKGEGWACPVSFGPVSDTTTEGSLAAEIAQLQPWYDLSVQHRGRTTFGASGLELDRIVRLITDLLEPAPGDDAAVPSADLLKLATEDLKAFYFEAALAQPEGASSLAVQDWFWGETEAARLLYRLRDALGDNSDPAIRRFAGWLLVPQTQVHR